MFSWWMRPERALPGRPGSSRKPAAKKRARLSLESLEDRLTPSTLSYNDWRLQSFQVDDQPVSLVGPYANQDQPVHQNFGSLIGLDRAFASYGYRGQGVSVAVIDTGIDYNHPDLGGGWGERVVAGYDFVNNDADPMDDNGHGTHVAGIVGSSSTTFSGVAPDAKLIALKVLDASGNGNFGNVEAALQWVVAHQAEYNIVAVNLSLGSGNYHSSPYLYVEDEFQALKDRDVFVAVAAGNSFYSYGSNVGLAFPAVSERAVSVGAVWTGDYGSVGWLSGARDHTTAPDRVASFSQRSSALDLVAPGAMITSTYRGGGYKAMAGTSMASPVVAGAAALVHQALAAAGRPANQDAILDILQSTGKAIVDGDDENDNVVNTGLTFQRLDVGAALLSIGTEYDDGNDGDDDGGQTPGNRAPVLTSIAPRNVAAGGAFTVALQAFDPDGDEISFDARVVAAGNQAYQLKVELGLSYLGDYYTGVYGVNEKWLGGANNQWYCILPNGELRRWAGTMDATLQSAQLVARLDASYYAEPSLLWDAQPSVAPPVTVSVTGNVLAVAVAANYSGSFRVEVSASDGVDSSKTTFTVNVQNSAPTLAEIGNVSMRRNQTAKVKLQVGDADGDALSFSVRALGSNYLAYQLDQTLGLEYQGSYFQNSFGLKEKWLATANPQGPEDWYCILPNGEVRRYGESKAAVLSATNLVARLDASYYANPQLLWNAKLQAAPAVQLTLVGTELIVKPPKNYTGTFYVEVSVTDGFTTTRRVFAVRVTK